MSTRDVEGGSSDDLIRAAAANDAEWCEIVCRVHGQRGSYHDGAWTVPRRSPPLYPDAVMLEPTTRVDAVLAAVDSSPGCSLKDSYACLDLTPRGFHVLFEARWMCRAHDTPPPESHPSTHWERVHGPSALRGWERAWNQDAAPAGLFPPTLLEDDTVIVMAGYHHHAVVAGAIANRSAAVTGVTNVFSVHGDLDAAWRGCIGALMERVGNGPLVGFARGDDLQAAQRAGFVPLGPLRVWINGDLADSFGPLGEQRG